MFGELIDMESWTTVARRVLVASAIGMLAPAAGMALGLLALLLAPVACVAIPFMLSAFFGTANAEHQAAVRRSLIPRAHPLPAIAH
jgi:hypothetical protein